MSAERCEHGNVVEEWGETYRCYRCEPITERDLQAVERAAQEELEQRDARIAELERVVAQLAERAGIAFSPPETE